MESGVFTTWQETQYESATNGKGVLQEAIPPAIFLLVGPFRLMVTEGTCLRVAVSLAHVCVPAEE
jgi:hypothetical protein